MMLKFFLIVVFVAQAYNLQFVSKNQQLKQCPFDNILWVDDTSGFIRKYGELMIKYPSIQPTSNSIHDSVLRNANFAIRDYLHKTITRIDDYLSEVVQYLKKYNDESLRDTFFIQGNGELEFCDSNILCFGFSFAEQHWISGMSFVQCETSLSINAKSGKRVELSEILHFTEAQYDRLLDSINEICMERYREQTHTSEADSTCFFVTSFYRSSSQSQRSYTILNDKFVLSKKGISFKTSPDKPLSVCTPVFFSYKELATIGLVNLQAARKYVK